MANAWNSLGNGLRCTVEPSCCCRAVFRDSASFIDQREQKFRVRRRALIEPWRVIGMTVCASELNAQLIVNQFLTLENQILKTKHQISTTTVRIMFKSSVGLSECLKRSTGISE
jgi:hypothetical protein